MNEYKRERKEKKKRYAVPSSEIAYVLFARELKKRKRTNKRKYKIGQMEREKSGAFLLRFVWQNACIREVPL